MSTVTELLESDASARTAAVIRVGRSGRGGRGFVIEADRHRYVITAAHCLPRLPPAHPAAYTEERTYPKLLGVLGRRPTVWAECVFVDPVTDIAVLSEPDGQELYQECEAYAALTDPVTPFVIGTLPFVQREHRLSNGDSILLPPRAEAPGQTLSLAKQWFSCTVSSGGRLASVEQPEVPIESGMSGSPILGPDGRVVALISTGKYYNPLLAACLPGWLLSALATPA